MFECHDKNTCNYDYLSYQAVLCKNITYTLMGCSLYFLSCNNTKGKGLAYKDNASYDNITR